MRSERSTEVCGWVVVVWACALGGEVCAESPPTSVAYEALTFHHVPKPLQPGAVTSDWPQFGGPTHEGISPESKLLKAWPIKGPALVWEMRAGTGYASPSIVGDRLVFFHRVGEQEVVDCLQSETGMRFWRYGYTSRYKDRYGFSNGPRSTPIIDSGFVYTHGAEGTLHCLDLMTGKVVWTRNTSKEYNVSQNHFGVGASPLIEGDLLIVNVGGAKGESVVAFDKKTGEVRWTTMKKWGASYATPRAVTLHDKRRVLVFAGGESRPPTGGLLTIDPSDGSTDFEFPFRSKRYESVNAASPVVLGNHIFLSTSYRTGGVMLEAKATGPPSIVWRTTDLETHFTTPIHVDGYLYGFDGSRKSNGAIVCLDAKTGRQMWREAPEWNEEVVKNGKTQMVSYGAYIGSLIYVDGNFLCLTDQGHLLSLDLTPDGCKVIARSWLFAANESFATPVVSRGLLYVTQNQKDFLTGKPPRLLCYDLRALQ